MIVFNKLPIANAPRFTIITNDDVRRFVTALLIEEHGVKMDNNRSSYAIKSPIYHSMGFGNIVLDTYKRTSDTKANKFSVIGVSDFKSDSIKRKADLESKYDIDINSAVRWTGSASSPTVYEYAVLESFAAFEKYVSARFNLKQGLPSSDKLRAMLQSYSGNVQGYANAVLSIMGDTKVVNI